MIYWVSRCSDEVQTTAFFMREASEVLVLFLPVSSQELTLLQKQSSEESARDRAKLVLLREKLAAYETMEQEVDAALNFLAAEGCDGAERERGRAAEEAKTLSTPATRRLQESLFLAKKLRSKTAELQTVQMKLQDAEKRIAHLERESFILRASVDSQHKPQSWLQSRLRDKELELLSTREQLQEAQETLERQEKLVERTLEEKTRLTLELKDLAESRTVWEALKHALRARKSNQTLGSRMNTRRIVAGLTAATQHRLSSSTRDGNLLPPSRSSSERRRSALKSLLQRLLAGQTGLRGSDKNDGPSKTKAFCREWQSRKNRLTSWDLPHPHLPSQHAEELGDKCRGFLPQNENPLPIVIGDETLPDAVWFGQENTGAARNSSCLLSTERGLRENAMLSFLGKRQQASAGSPKKNFQTRVVSRGATMPEMKVARICSTQTAEKRGAPVCELEKTTEKSERVGTPEKMVKRKSALGRDPRCATPADKENFRGDGEGIPRRNFSKHKPEETL
uniref:Putative myosin heavy chain n=2 Tax=Toxoplasma gondii TaxID=5811 RepID=A0A2G8Y521_TOXGO|nr:putative myosin heavy chain [Toxoplasma gondii COUG]